MVNAPAANVFFNQLENIHLRAVSLSNNVEKLSAVNLHQMSHIVSEILKNTEYLENQIKNSSSLTFRQFRVLNQVAQEVKRKFQVLKVVVEKDNASSQLSKENGASAMPTLDREKLQLKNAISHQRVFTQAMERYSFLLNRHLSLLAADVDGTTYRDLDNCKVRAVNMVFKLKIFQKIIEYTPDLTASFKKKLVELASEQLVLVQVIFKKLSKNTDLDVDSLDITDHAVKVKSSIEEITDKISQEAHALLKEVTDLIVAETERKSTGKGVLLNREESLPKIPLDQEVRLPVEEKANCVVS